MYVADRLIEAVARIDYPHELLEIQVLDDSTDETRKIAELSVQASGRRRARHQVHQPGRPDRLQGWRARGRAENGARRIHRDFRCRFPAQGRLPDPADAAFRGRPGRDGSGAVGSHQSGLLAAHQDPVDSARRPFRARARRAQPRRLFLQFQRHGRRLAARGDRGRRRLAARHADRGSRPQLPGAIARLALRLRARRDCAGGSAGRDECLQVAAASLGQRVDPDLPQAAADDSARRMPRSASRSKRSFI